VSAANGENLPTRARKWFGGLGRAQKVLAASATLVITVGGMASSATAVLDLGGRMGIAVLASDSAPDTTVSESKGVRVTKVIPGSPADRAGLEVGDVITAVDGKSVEDVDDFREAMGKADGDEPVKVTVPNRKGPQPVSIEPRSGKGDDLGIRVPVNDPVPEEGDPRTPDGKPDGPQEPDDEPDGPQPQGLKNAEPTYAPARVPESKAPEPPSGADASVEQYSAED
jgi:serine protease DegQ